jgi:type VI secretion system protein ImpC
LAQTAARARAPFLAAAANAVVGCDVPIDCANPSNWSARGSTTTAFRALRRSSAATYVGLTWPRWLLRLPYGARRDPIESFPFEEMTGRPSHDSLLWGNGAFVAAAALAIGFREDPESMPPDGPFTIGDVPVYSFTDEDGESKMQPGAECWLSDTGYQAALDRGVMPIVSMKGRDEVTLVRLQSIADPPTALDIAD